LAAELPFVGFSSDSRLLATVAAGKGLKVWNLEKLEEVATLPKSPANPGPNGMFSFAVTNQAVAVGNTDGTVEVWDLLRKDRAANWRAHRDVVTGVAFMPDGKRLVTVSSDNTARLWDVETQREVRSFGRALNAFYSVAVSPDGGRIAGGTWDQGIKIWDSGTGQELATLKGIHDWLDPYLRGRWDAVESLVFLPPDGNTLISGTVHEVRIWRAPAWAEIAAAEKWTEGKTQ
jgi:WD40 repeat protein